MPQAAGAIGNVRSVVALVIKAKMKELGFCTQPDRHEPKLLCGYPLPCPYHTLVLNEEKAFDLLDRLDQVDGDPDDAGEEES